MDKLIGTIVVCGLVLLLFLGVFQDSMGGNVSDQGENVGTTLNGVSTSNTGNIGTPNTD